MVRVMSLRLARLWCVSLVTGLTATAAAQLPQVVPISGVLSDAAGEAVEGETQLVLAIYNQRSGGEPLYSERTMVTPVGGRFSHYLGSGESAQQFDLAMFGGGSEFYLGITIGDDEEATPRILIGSVPYAAFAHDAETVGGKAPDAFQPRVSGMCESHEAIQGFDALGGVQCATIQTPAGGTLTGIGTSAGSGLTGGCSSGTCQLSIDFSDLQRRAVGSCEGGQFMVALGEDGTVQCVTGYRDSDAVAAMGPKSNSNPLNHDRYTDAAAVAAMGPKANSNPLNHDRMVCFQAEDDCAANPCQVFCDDYDGAYGDTNDFMAVGGGCDLASGATLSESSPTYRTGSFPTSPTTAFDGWNCEGNGAADIQGAYVICCR